MLHLTPADTSTVAALLAVLARERRVFVYLGIDMESTEADRSAASELVGLIDHVAESIRAGRPIDLDAERSHKSAEWDRGIPTAGGYLLCLIRDEFNDADWQRLAALGVVAVKITGPEPPHV